MATYRSVRNNILTDLFRVGTLTAQANTAIQDAVKFYEGEPFWFNETRATASTVSAQAFYGVPYDFVELVSLTITINGSTHRLLNKPYEYIEERHESDDSSLGYPQVYAIYDEQIRLWPIPNSSAWSLTFSYIRRFDDLEDEGDTNVWTNEAEALIRARAEGYLLTRILDEPDKAGRVRRIEAEEFTRLKGETNRRLMTGRPRKRAF